MVNIKYKETTAVGSNTFRLGFSARGGITRDILDNIYQVSNSQCVCVVLCEKCLLSRQSQSHCVHDMRLHHLSLFYLHSVAVLACKSMINMATLNTLCKTVAMVLRNIYNVAMRDVQQFSRFRPRSRITNLK